MKRIILAPPVLPAAAVDELKAWLAITNNGEDAALADLLRASLDMCEAFTGRLPISCLCEEVHEVRSGWQALLAGPVISVETVESVAKDGARFPMAAGDYRAETGADGNGRFRVLQGTAVRVAVRFTAGIAQDWASLPPALRHGIVRCAAHFHRMRDSGEGEAAPPAAIAALWRGWRRMRFA